MEPTGIRHAPAFLTAVLFATGILAGRLLPRVPLPFLLFVFLILLLGGLLALVRPSLTPRGLLACLILFCCFSGIVKERLDSDGVPGIPDAYLNRPAKIAGLITDPPTAVGNRVRFVVEAASIAIDTVWLPASASLLVNLVEDSSDTCPERLEYGMAVIVRGVPERPSDERNPGEFNARRYYEANGISCMVSTRGRGNVVVIGREGGSAIMRKVVVPLRRALLCQIDEVVGGEEGEFLKGLLIGERSGIRQSTRQAFVNAGVAHVLAVSGSNVAVVAAFLLFAAGALRFSRLLRFITVGAGLVLYMLLTGSQPPVVRATVMGLIFVTAEFFQQKANAYNATGLAALLILGLDARWLFDVGFQLSFGAVLSIVYLYPRVNRWISRIVGRSFWQRGTVTLLRVCAVSVVATLGTLPMTASSFGRVSVIGILANVVVIPAAGASVVLGLVSAMAGAVSGWLGAVYGATNWLVLHLTLLVTDAAGNSPLAFIDTLRFLPAHAVPFYALLGLIFHLDRPVVVRVSVLVLLASLNLLVFLPEPAAFAPPDGKLRLSFIDVGQGDAILVEGPGGKSVLIDTGPLMQGGDAGERIVVPFMKRRGISALDLLVLTHDHEDHTGGAKALGQAFPIRHVVASVHSLLPHFVRCGADTGSIGAGSWIEGNFPFRLYVLSPAADVKMTDTSAGESAGNNRSVVIKLHYGQVGMILEGDAERDAEQAMVTRYGDFLRAALLKAAHHGSGTSSDERFLALVSPEQTVVSVGRHNRFGHPSPGVLRRFRTIGADLHRTDEEGALVYESDGWELRRVLWK
jgi:competence protein ComEC